MNREKNYSPAEIQAMEAALQAYERVLNYSQEELLFKESQIHALEELIAFQAQQQIQHQESAS